MSSVTCRQVRTYLAALESGAPAMPEPGVWDTLQGHGAVAGTASSPELTAVGRHVHSELQIRASRVDSLSLQVVAGQLTRVLGDLDQVAKTAEYFLAELGPVTPPDAIALLRPVSVALANRRETPEELAEQFRNVWGSVEVMGGQAADRLLAAELLSATGADLSKVYAPMMTTVSKIRAAVGEATPAVTSGAILHLRPPAADANALDLFLKIRPQVGSEQGAALLLGSGLDPAEALKLRDRFTGALGGDPKSRDLKLAATYLASISADPATAVPRVQVLSRALARRLKFPLVPAAVLSDLIALEPEEILNWLDKAFEIARTRRLAPTPEELTALAVAMVHGLPRHEFDERTGPVDPAPLPALVALYSWVYRPLLLPTRSSERAVPAA